MKEDNWQDIDLPEELDIEDAIATLEDNEEDVIYAGEVQGWKQQEFLEKARIRPYITGIIVLVWTIGIAITAVRFLATGDYLLFIPPTLITGPLCIILRFYYRSD